MVQRRSNLFYASLMFLRYRFVWLVISVFFVLIVGACGVTPSGVTEGLTAEQITAVGCDASASEGQIKRCFATVIGCDPQNLPDDQKMNECMKDRIETAQPYGFGCGPIEGEEAKAPNEIAACMVEAIQSGDIPHPETPPE